MSENRVNQPKWKIEGARVYGMGHSFNCTNKVTATELHQILQQYELENTQTTQIQINLDKLSKQIIQLKLTINILSDEIKTLQEMITDDGKNR